MEKGSHVSCTDLKTYAFHEVHMPHFVLLTLKCTLLWSEVQCFPHYRGHGCSVANLASLQPPLTTFFFFKNVTSDKSSNIFLCYWRQLVSLSAALCSKPSQNREETRFTSCPRCKFNYICLLIIQISDCADSGSKSYSKLRWKLESPGMDYAGRGKSLCPG